MRKRIHLECNWTVIPSRFCSQRCCPGQALEGQKYCEQHVRRKKQRVVIISHLSLSLSLSLSLPCMKLNVFVYRNLLKILNLIKFMTSQSNLLNRLIYPLICNPIPSHSMPISFSIRVWPCDAVWWVASVQFSFATSMRPTGNWYGSSHPFSLLTNHFRKVLNGDICALYQKVATGTLIEYCIFSI
jgi:hypothetical protein